MKLDEKQKQVSQMVALGLLTVICLGVVSFQFMGRKSAPPPAPVNPVDPQTATAGAEPIDKIADAVPMVFPDLGISPKRRDPFMPQMTASTVPVENNRHVVPKSERVKATNITPNPWTKVPSIPPVTPKVEQVTTSSNNGQANQSATDPDPSFALTGVIKGSNNVAIIRVGGNERHVVSQGQTINGRYKVISVTDDGAVLSCNSRRIQLKLGGIN
jgi:hypothetical protein